MKDQEEKVMPQKEETRRKPPNKTLIIFFLVLCFLAAFAIITYKNKRPRSSGSHNTYVSDTERSARRKPQKAEEKAGEASTVSDYSISTLVPGQLTLAFCINAPLFMDCSSEDPETAWEGLFYDIASLISDRMNCDLTVHVMDASDLLPSVQAQSADLAFLELPAPPESDKGGETDEAPVLYTAPVVSLSYTIIVPEDSKAASVENLQGNSAIGCIKDTSCAGFCESFFDPRQIVSYATESMAVEALRVGKTDAIVILSDHAEKYLRQDDQLKKIEPPLKTEVFSIAVSGDNPDLFKKVDSILKEESENGTISELVEKWFSFPD